MKYEIIPIFLNHIKSSIALAKIPISLWITLSACAGYLMYRPVLEMGLFLTCQSIFLLTCGCAALNNYQDRNYDLGLKRTRGRPLPSHRITPRHALVQAVFLILAGEGGLYAVHTSLALPVAGVVAILCYNLLYTPLKPITLLAIIPGAVCGMLPPAIGWIAAGGTLASLEIWSLMIIFAVWQPPHFWLILLSHSDDYRCQNASNMLKQFSEGQLNRMLLVWVTAFAALTLAPAMTQVVTNFELRCLLALNAMTIVILFSFLLFIYPPKCSYRKLFHFLNLSMFFVLALVVADQFIHYVNAYFQI